jgi:hypothetical protein
VEPSRCSADCGRFSRTVVALDSFLVAYVGIYDLLITLTLAIIRSNNSLFFKTCIGCAFFIFIKKKRIAAKQLSSRVRSKHRERTKHMASKGESLRRVGLKAQATPTKHIKLFKLVCWESFSEAIC